MEIQRQADQYALSSPMYHQASIPDEDLRDMLAGPRITAGYLNTREGIARTNPAGDLNMSPARMDQKALTTAPKPPKLPPLPKPESQPGVPKIQQQVQQNVASRRIMADSAEGDNNTGFLDPITKSPFAKWLTGIPHSDWANRNTPKPGDPPIAPGPGGDIANRNIPKAPDVTPVADKGAAPSGGGGGDASKGTYGPSQLPANQVDPKNPANAPALQGPNSTQMVRNTFGGEGTGAGTGGALGTGSGYGGAGFGSSGDWAKSQETTHINPGSYTVKPGDTAGDISQRAGLGGGTSGIGGLGSNPSLITPGQSLTIPTGGTSAPAAPAAPGGGGTPPAAPAAQASGGFSGQVGKGEAKTSSYRIARDAYGNSYFDDSKGYRYFLAQGGDPAGDNTDLAEEHRRENQPAATPGPTKDLANAGGPTKDKINQGQPGQQPGRDLKAPAAPAGGPKDAAPAGTPPGVKMTTDSVPPVGGGAPAGGDYTVNKGDTLSGIAQSHGLGGNYQAIVDANPGAMASGTDIKSNPNMIHPGDVFKMPGAAPAGPAAVMPPAPTSETVAPGEAPVPGFVPPGGRGPMPGGMFVPPKAASRQGITCQGSSHYPLAQHQKLEGLYRCAGCGQWGPVTVLSKMVEHRLIQADDRTPGAPTPMAGEANSAMPTLAPLTGTGAPGVASATDALTQSAGSSVLPTLRQV